MKQDYLISFFFFFFSNSFEIPSDLTTIEVASYNGLQTVLQFILDLNIVLPLHFPISCQTYRQFFIRIFPDDGWESGMSVRHSAVEFSAVSCTQISMSGIFPAQLNGISKSIVDAEFPSFLYRCPMAIEKQQYKIKQL